MPFGRTDDSAFLSRGQDGVKDQLHVLHILMAVIFFLFLLLVDSALP